MQGDSVCKYVGDFVHLSGPVNQKTDVASQNNNNNNDNNNAISWLMYKQFQNKQLHPPQPFTLAPAGWFGSRYDQQALLQNSPHSPSPGGQSLHLSWNAVCACPGWSWHFVGSVQSPQRASDCHPGGCQWWRRCDPGWSHTGYCLQWWVDLD